MSNRTRVAATAASIAVGFLMLTIADLSQAVPATLANLLATVTVSVLTGGIWFGAASQYAISDDTDDDQDDDDPDYDDSELPAPAPVVVPTTF